MHVVLVEPEIHWNTGNVGRTCLAVGAQLHLVEPCGFSLDERQVRRAGLDYWPKVNPKIWPSWAAFEAVLPTLGQPFFFASGGSRRYWDATFPNPSVLIFGRESVGLSVEILARFPTDIWHIPMLTGSIRSLNLSTSAALAMYEVSRQWDAASFRGPP